MKRKLENITGKNKYVPVHDDPLEELRLLVRQHSALAKQTTAMTNASSDRKHRETGEVIKCNLPFDACEEIRMAVSILTKKSGQLERRMTRNLKRLDLYKLFLAKVYSVGPVTAAYLITKIDIEKATYISQVQRYCGIASVCGKIEKGSKGELRHYAEEMRTVLYQAFDSMWRTTGGENKTHKETKYTKIWLDYKRRMQHSERVVDGKIMVNGKWRSAKKFINSTGRLKATDVLLEDYYILARTLKGLPVFPSYYQDKLGIAHGGTMASKEPRMLTVDEALDLIGDVGANPVVIAMAAE